MLQRLVKKIEALKRPLYVIDSSGAYYMERIENNKNVIRNQTINDVLAMPEIQAVDELIKELSDLWLIKYPEDIFDGSSGDEGALKVVRIRELLKVVQGEAD